MNSLPVSLTLYTTTKGHFGYKDCPKHTVDHISTIGEGCFSSKSVHIKVCDNKDGDEKFKDLDRYFKKKSFNVVSTKGSWNRKNNNHAIEYFKDMETLMNEDLVHDNEFIFFHEDDWIINTEKPLIYLLQEGIKYMRRNKDLICVRVNADINTDISKATKISNDIYLQNEDYTQFGPTITFQPTLMRTRDWYAAVRQINRNDLRFKSHCELLSGMFMKGLFATVNTPFAFYDPNVINATHIGSEEFAKENNNNI